MKKQLIEKYRRLIQNRMGISISNEKTYLLRSKLNRLSQNANIKDFNGFYQAIEAGDPRSTDLLTRFIVTNHTYFFREICHLKILAEHIKACNWDFTYIWCAAASTGEEVYSIIIYLLEKGIKNFIVLASDINSQGLVIAKKGIYREDKLSHVPLNFRKKYFKRILVDGIPRYQINPQLKNYWKAKKINLLDLPEFKGNMHYIFCRNVLIYFNNLRRKEVVSHLFEKLNPQGLLFLGLSESLLASGISVDQVGTSVYRMNQ